jgi:RNA polymerase primary sigma factor
MANAPVTKTRTRQARAVALRLAVAELGIEPAGVEEVIRQLGQLAVRQRQSGAPVTQIEREAGMSAAALERLLATVRATQEQVRAAKHVLIESNLRLVAAIARRYRNRGMEFADVLQEGNLGLMRAADRFDHRRGYRFSTCAKWWIRKAITYAIADRARTIRIPVDVVAAIEKVKMVARRLAHDLGREPEAADLAARLRLPVERVERLMRLGTGIAREPISLEASTGDDDDRTLGETIEDAAAVNPLDGACASRMRDEARDALSLLDDRERLVLRLRFGIEARSDHTLEEIGGRLSVTRERVRQIEAKALAKLRRSEFAPVLRASVEA